MKVWPTKIVKRGSKSFKSCKFRTKKWFFYKKSRKTHTYAPKKLKYGLKWSLEDTLDDPWIFNPILRLHRSTKWNFFFLYWYETSPFCTILGRWFRTRHPFFAITSKFCSIANFMVARTENQFFAFCEKTIRDIENLNTYRRFKIKFCAF